jgi:hypothetical protein
VFGVELQMVVRSLKRVATRTDESLVEERGGWNLLRRSAGEWKGTEDMGGIAGLWRDVQMLYGWAGLLLVPEY